MSVCSFMFACQCVYVPAVCNMHATLYNYVYAFLRMYVSFKSIGARLSYMCLRVLKLSGSRLPEAGLY